MLVIMAVVIIMAVFAKEVKASLPEKCHNFWKNRRWKNRFLRRSKALNSGVTPNWTAKGCISLYRKEQQGNVAKSTPSVVRDRRVLH
jgi:hypothetical protein